MGMVAEVAERGNGLIDAAEPNNAGNDGGKQPGCYV
jgi:hypothetical protein